VGEQAPTSWKDRKVGPLGITIAIVILSAIVVGGAIASRDENVRVQYYLWQVRRGHEPGPYLARLRDMGAKVVPAIGEALSRGPAVSQRRLLELLRDIACPQASGFAAKLLDDPSAEVRMAAVRVFQTCGKVADIPVVYAMLDDPDELVRAMACGALGRITGVDLDPDPKLWREYFKNHPELLDRKKPPTDK